MLPSRLAVESPASLHKHASDSRGIPHKFASSRYNMRAIIGNRLLQAIVAQVLVFKLNIYRQISPPLSPPILAPRTRFYISVAPRQKQKDVRHMYHCHSS